jgi:hypothetical protein
MLRAAFGGSERKSAISFVIDNKAYVGTGKGYSGKKDSWYVYEPSNYAALEELEASIQIYPNPVVSALHISGMTGQIVDVTIYNSSGRKLKTLDLSASYESFIDVSMLESGVFICGFRLADGQVLTKKIVKS